MADAQDSKSCGGDLVWVQVPPSAVEGAKPDSGFTLFFSYPAEGISPAGLKSDGRRQVEKWRIRECMRNSMAILI